MQSKVWCVVCLVLGCAAETDANQSVDDAARLELLAQRVTATVKRKAATLVRLETEHEAFLTTPEHPFATPGSGWIPAGQLVVGDRVVSARFGTVRVVALHRETPARPVPVFNLSVDPSHAYLVGTDHVLVHNVGCQGQADPDPSPEETDTITRHTRDLEAIEIEIEKLKSDLSSAQDKTEILKQLDDLKQQRDKVKRRIRASRRHRKIREQGPRHENLRPPVEDARTRHARALAALELAIEQAQRDLLSAPDDAVQKHLDVLKKQRTSVKKKLADSTAHHRKKLGEHSTLHEQLLERAEADYESVKSELEATQSALRELDAQTPRSNAEKETALKRKSELEKRLKAQEADLASADQIRIWEREVAEYERSTTGKSKDPDLEQHIRELKVKLADEKDTKKDRRRWRRKREDAEQNEQLRNTRARTVRAPIEILTEELVTLQQQPASPSRDQRIAYLTDAVQTLKGLAEFRKKFARANSLLWKARKRRKELIDRGKDTTKIDETIARVLTEQETRRTARTRLRAHGLLLGLKHVRRGLTRQAADEARFLAFEQELADPATIDEQRLAEIERDLAESMRDLAESVPGESDTLDAEFFEGIWREAEAEIANSSNVSREDPTTDALRDGLNRESEDVNDALRALAEELQRSPSPERVTEVQASLDRLQAELAEERQRFQDLDLALGTQAAALAESLEGPGSSHTIQKIRPRLEHIRAERTRLRSNWLERTQARLAEARRQLRDHQSSDRLRNEVIEAELAQQIALLEYELAAPPFKT